MGMWECFANTTTAELQACVDIDIRLLNVDLLYLLTPRI